MNLEPEPITCVACQHTECSFVTQARPGRNMVRCKQCGLIFVIPQWTPEIAADVFENFDGWPGGIVGGADNRNESMSFMAREIIKYYPDGGCLLDIGCSNGIFFKVMDQQADTWQFYGTEPDLRWQNNHYQPAEVIFQPLRQCSFPDNFFDVVTILDALYYIPEPDKELAEIARILKPEGILLFDVPGIRYLRLRGLVGAPFGMERTCTFAAYPFYFSNYSLQLLLNHAGLRVENILIDRGVTRQKSALRLIMSLYMHFIKVAHICSRKASTLSPKQIYVARREKADL